jgi:uroporphyrinogen decarboxylase
MVTSRERFLATLQHRTLDRIPIYAGGAWPETVERWQREGMPTGVSVEEYYGFDIVDSCYPFRNDFFPHEIYEETEEYCIDQNWWGTVSKWKKHGGSSAGHIELEHRIQTMEDWRRHRERFDVNDARFYVESWQPAPDRFAYITTDDHFWMSFKMLGMENLCCWLASEPEEMREIYDDYLDFLIGMLDRTAARDIQFDAVWFFTDMAYHSGPMFSPSTYREVIMPGYTRLREWCTKHEKYMLLHCDGNLDALMPLFIETGFDWIHPLEARAGNDVRQLKPRYGDKITLVGNINADILASGDRAAIKEEISSKVPVAKEHGGYVYYIDHSIPPTISFDDHNYAINLVNEYGQY